LFAILLGATLGEFLLGKIGSLFQKVLFVPPFKFIDSLLGAVISLIRTAFVLSVVAILLVFSNWSLADQYVSTSFFYQTLDLKLPSVMESFAQYFG
jgi:hypothetical protein